MTASPAVDTDAEKARAGLVDALDAQGVLDDPVWRAAVATVPRHLFVPGFWTEDGTDADGFTRWVPRTEASSRAAWLEHAYADRSLVTQFDNTDTDWATAGLRTGGVPTSSSTLPSLVLRMWRDADIHDDHRVLEIGTGTGYSTALACQRLGSSQVTSLEVDSTRLAEAHAALAQAGYFPRLAVADGLYGYWPEAPFHRIVAACSVRRIPAAWVEQTRVGGKILATLGGWSYGYARALLTKNADGSAEGPLLSGTVSFMPARADAAPDFGNPSDWAQRAGLPNGETSLDPASLEIVDDATFHLRLLVQSAIPNAQWVRQGGDVVLIDVTTGSVARVKPTDGPRGWTVAERGPVSLWRRVEAAVGAWEASGRPGPDRYGLTVEADGTHRLWIGEPGNVVSVLPMQ